MKATFRHVILTALCGGLAVIAPAGFAPRAGEHQEAGNREKENR